MDLAGINARSGPDQGKIGANSAIHTTFGMEQQHCSQPHTRHKIPDRFHFLLNPHRLQSLEGELVMALWCRPLCSIIQKLIKHDGLPASVIIQCLGPLCWSQLNMYWWRWGATSVITELCFSFQCEDSVMKDVGNEASKNLWLCLAFKRLYEILLLIIL